MVLLQTWISRARTALQQVPAAEDGQDIVEYALLAGFVSIIALAIILLVGPYLSNEFQFIVHGLSTA
jgi:Flp pilus assembly pilin Flp